MFFRRASESASADMRLIVGLGNIGKSYEHTRHNVGFAVADALARTHSAHFRVGKFHGDQTVITLDGHRVLLLKPHTLMNLSGEAVVAAARFYKLAPAQILVICDDINLPLGRLRIRARGSDGGHNGLWSVLHRLGSEEFPRIRIGVGAPPPGMDMVGYVLSRFLTDERPRIAETIQCVAEAAETWATEGTEAAMNRWNAAPSPPNSPPDAD